MQKKLYEYTPIWNEITRLWHIKANAFHSTREWKIQQELTMLKERGSALSKRSFEGFINMINRSIPHTSLMSINADVVARINSDRLITWIGKGCDESIYLKQENLI